MITIYLIEFLLFSMIGGILDLLYNGISSHRWRNTGYFGMPFCPIYGIGALVLILLYKTVSFLGLIPLLIIGSIGMIIVEYLGGVFMERVIQVKVWDYSSARFNLSGYVDLLHSFYWFILVALFYSVLLPIPLFLEKSTKLVPEYLDLPLTILFVIALLWLTIRRLPARYLIIKDKVITISLERYQKVFSNIKQLYRTSSIEKKRQLERLIQQQLKNTGAYLKKINWNRK